MKKARVKRGISLNLQMIMAFLGLIVLIIAVGITMNTFFLESYYISNKENAMRSAYSLINSVASEETYSSEEVSIEIQRVCATHNISMIILDETTKVVLASQDDTDILTRQLLGNLFGRGTIRIGEGVTDEDASGEIFGWNNAAPEDNTEKADGVLSGEQSGNEIEPPQDGSKKGGVDVEVDTVLETKDSYTLQISADIRSGDRYLEMWGILDNGSLFLLRSAVDSISDSVSMSNRFLIYVGIIVSSLGAVMSLFVSRKISGPVMELTEISSRMKALDFNAKYTGNVNNEIGVLGENINELSETLEKTISELKTANNVLEMDLEQKTRIDDMRKEFLSNVSHELKTPLALIQGYAEGLKDCVNEDEDSRDFYCEVIIDEASKMNTMVKKLLTLNQLEFGADTVTMERFDITALIRNYIQSADILIKQSEARVHFEDYPPVYVWADEFKTEEVFANYFSNALNHLEGERKIDISIRNTEKDIVRVSVFNTGRPIPEESIAHIWDKFYKVDRARTREYGGSGVGLSIVKAIQESIHRDFGVINYNNGVEFYFELDCCGQSEK